VKRRALALAALLLVLGPAYTHASELLVFAAASLTDVLGELAVRWEKAGHERIAFSFGASNDLARQIQAGAPADVFFSADAARVVELEKAGLVKAGTSRIALSNTLVVVVPAAAPPTIREPGDLKTVRRLALANPEGVPAGMYARKWLESQGLWEVLAPKVVPALDVRAALAAVAAEQAEAGIVYATDAALSKKVRVAVRVPREQGPPIAYALAPIASSKNAEEARALVAFLTSAGARPVYERFGFIVTSGE
jgi:molybdate transport system substrate-binding protein